MHKRTLDHLVERYSKLARNLQDWQLQTEAHSDLLEEDILEDLQRHAGISRFLGFYSREGMRVAMDAYGISDAISHRGYPNIRLKLDTSDPYHHRFYVYSDTGEKLVELRAAILDRLSEVDTPCFRDRRFLHIEWLMMQDPGRPFGYGQEQEDGHRPLPGQDHPGLGIGAEIMAVLVMVCRRLKLDGLVAHPAWFHNAWFYHLEYRFADPFAEGRFRALTPLVKKHGFWKISWAFEAGALTDSVSGQALVWQGSELLRGTGDFVKAYFGSSAYVKTRRKARREARYVLDEDMLDAYLTSKMTPGEQS